jgi:hypothetical protein
VIRPAGLRDGRGIAGAQRDALGQTALANFLPTHLEHAFRHIHAHRGGDAGRAAEQGKNLVRRAGGHIQQEQRIAGGQIACHALPPGHVLPERQHAIQQIVARRNAVKHLPYVAARWFSWAR